MQCEPRWGDGLSTSNIARVERSPRPVTHLAMRADPPPQGAGERRRSLIPLLKVIEANKNPARKEARRIISTLRYRTSLSP